ncbi:MAG: squalene/phytoene synthase family protein [Gammaproteobacteria bacterium]
MSTADPANARAWCRERLAAPGEDLALAALFTAPALRPAVTATGALYVELETVATRFRDLDIARTKLGWWRDELTRLDSGRPAHPATQLIAATGIAPPVVALGDLLTGFELILLEGPVKDLATARLFAERGYARLALVLSQLFTTADTGSAPLARLGIAMGLARVLALSSTSDETRPGIAAAARDGLRGTVPEPRLLPPPLRVLAALAWQHANGAPQGAAGRGVQPVRVITAWRAARGRLPPALTRA